MALTFRHIVSAATMSSCTNAEPVLTRELVERSCALFGKLYLYNTLLTFFDHLRRIARVHSTGDHAMQAWGPRKTTGWTLKRWPLCPATWRPEWTPTGARPEPWSTSLLSWRSRSRTTKRRQRWEAFLQLPAGKAWHLPSYIHT